MRASFSMAGYDPYDWHASNDGDHPPGPRPSEEPLRRPVFTFTPSPVFTFTPSHMMGGLRGATGPSGPSARGMPGPPGPPGRDARIVDPYARRDTYTSWLEPPPIRHRIDDGSAGASDAAGTQPVYHENHRRLRNLLSESLVGQMMAPPDAMPEASAATMERRYEAIRRTGMMRGEVRGIILERRQTLVVDVRDPAGERAQPTDGAEEDDASIVLEDECVVCYTASPTASSPRRPDTAQLVSVASCRHRCVCSSCARDLTKCPLCQHPRAAPAVLRPPATNMVLWPRTPETVGQWIGRRLFGPHAENGGQWVPLPPGYTSVVWAFDITHPSDTIVFDYIGEYRERDSGARWRWSAPVFVATFAVPCGSASPSSHSARPKPFVRRFSLMHGDESNGVLPGRWIDAIARKELWKNVLGPSSYVYGAGNDPTRHAGVDPVPEPPGVAATCPRWHRTTSGPRSTQDSWCLEWPLDVPALWNPEHVAHMSRYVAVEVMVPLTWDTLNRDLDASLRCVWHRGAPEEPPNVEWLCLDATRCWPAPPPPPPPPSGGPAVHAPPPFHIRGAVGSFFPQSNICVSWDVRLTLPVVGVWLRWRRNSWFDQHLRGVTLDTNALPSNTPPPRVPYVRAKRYALMDAWENLRPGGIQMKWRARWQSVAGGGGRETNDDDDDNDFVTGWLPAGDPDYAWWKHQDCLPPRTAALHVARAERVEMCFWFGLVDDPCSADAREHVEREIHTSLRDMCWVHYNVWRVMGDSGSDEGWVFT